MVLLFLYNIEKKRFMKHQICRNGYEKLADCDNSYISSFSIRMCFRSEEI